MKKEKKNTLAKPPKKLSTVSSRVTAMRDSGTPLPLPASLFDEDGKPNSVQIAICTCEPGCTAPVNGHESDCPVEQQLKEEFGF